MTGQRKEYKKIFISWSGENSKEIAKNLKDVLENFIFKDTGLECFVSDVDISSGDDWWNKIKTELKKCKLGIVCVTKENLRAPWIYFESGAMIARDLKLIPLLINCSFKALRDTPISTTHMVDFYGIDRFQNMVKTINRDLKLTQITDIILDEISLKYYSELISKSSETLKRLKAMRVFNEKYTYPSKITTVNLNTIYISAPMSSIKQKEYLELREFLHQLKSVLTKIGFTNIVCPAFDNPDYNHFEGSTKAIKENFVKMKQVDSMIVIYPHNIASSVLVEIGYGLALCKKTVIFYNDTLPYILKDAGTSISHFDCRKYSGFDDIMNIIVSNGKQLFKRDEEE